MNYYNDFCQTCLGTRMVEVGFSAIKQICPDCKGNSKASFPNFFIQHRLTVVELTHKKVAYVNDIKVQEDTHIDYIQLINEFHNFSEAKCLDFKSPKNLIYFAKKSVPDSLHELIKIKKELLDE